MRASYALGFVGFTALSACGQALLYGQCGGLNWTGATTCVSGAVCTYQNDYYSQCVLASAVTTTTCPNATPTTTPNTTPATTPNTTPATTPNTTPATTPNTTPATTPNTTPTTNPSTAPTTTPNTTPTTTNPSTTPTGACGAPPASAGKLTYAGVNIAGFDFGMGTGGDGTASAAYPPLAEYNNADGAGQMAHFVNDDKYNIFRLPVGWQFLTNNVATGTLDQAAITKYDTLVRACLATGAKCIIDIHNYARWNGHIIGQGGPSNEVFASLWSSLASSYVNETSVVFGIMNEPHDLDITLWAATVQAAVTAIREAGATTQMILLPGDTYTSAATFVSGGSAAALSTVTNPDGSYTNLIFDVHRYLDSDSSGTSDTCVTNNIAEAWEPLSQWLRCNGRQALNTETGGGNTASCQTYMCQQIQYQAENSDVILGYVGWAAGSFATSYALSETPTNSGTTWTDQPLVAACMAPVVNGHVA